MCLNLYFAYLCNISTLHVHTTKSKENFTVVHIMYNDYGKKELYSFFGCQTSENIKGASKTDLLVKWASGEKMLC